MIKATVDMESVFTLTLTGITEDQLKHLRTLVQNPIGYSCETEPRELVELRLALFNEIKSMIGSN